METGKGMCARDGQTNEITYFCGSLFSNCNNIGPVVRNKKIGGLNKGGQGISCWDPSIGAPATKACTSSQWRCSVKKNLFILDYVITFKKIEFFLKFH